MSDESSNELIRELTRDLETVSPLPPMRVVVGAVVGIWIAVALAGVAVNGLRPDWIALVLSPFGPGGMLLGLGVAGLGGLVAAVAMCIPGREGAARAGLGVAFAGMAWAAGVGTLLFVNSPVAEVGPGPAADLHCLGVACAVALLPAVGVVLFAGRATPFRPLVLVIAAAASSAALGAVAAQASCPANTARHLMLGHLLAPGVGALLLSLPLLVALRRSARSQSRALRTR